MLMAKRRDLYRQRKRRPQPPAGQLRLVHDANKLRRAHFHHLLAQESAYTVSILLRVTIRDPHKRLCVQICTSTAFYQIQLFIYIIRAIDGNIDFGPLVQGYKWDAQLFSLFSSAFRCWYTNDILQISRLQLLSHSFYRKIGCGTSSQTNNHTGPHIVINSFVANLYVKFK
jgi:hypothetical protein